MSSGRTDVPENANQECPGTQSDKAGKASSCSGCPNQQACASGAAQKPNPAVELVREKMKDIKHVILVLSGKGGVGKSTFSTQLAFAFAAQGKQVGLLDIDICGPSVPRMLGLEGRQVHQSGTGWSPVWVEDNLGVMSIGFMLPSTDDAIIWRGPKKNGLITQFLTDVEWGALDYLIIDTPPGTSDEHISIVQLLRGANVEGAMIVTTPQEISMLDVRKEISFCRKTQLKVLGVVENMAGFKCPGCGDITQVFPESGTGPRGMADKFSVPYLGKVPLDPRILDCCEAGVPYVVRYPEAPAAPAFRNVVKQVLEATREEDGPYDMTYGGCDIMEEDDAAEGETSTSKQVSKNTVKEGVQSTELRIKSELLTKLRSEAATLTPEMRNAFEALLAKV